MGEAEWDAEWDRRVKERERRNMRALDGIDYVELFRQWEADKLAHRRAA